MKLPLEITFRNVARTDELEERIRTKAAKLDRFFDNITGCRVVVESPHNHHQKGNRYLVRIDLSVPGGEIVVNRDQQTHDHEDIGIALRDAFSAAQRQLQAYAEKHNPATSHENMRISEILPS
ncbi:MAG: ribosome-associated translation inhibitor RaiA [Deltaproteobacteria bacterium]|nr:ribosome-associated translation inhibitor RaiA [Nannocystaceae bacterium]